MDNASLLNHFLAQGKIALEPASFLYQAPSPLPRDWDFGRVEGMLLGLVIGDALGKTTESLLPAYRKHTYGEIRDYLPIDTQMVVRWVCHLMTRKWRFGPWSSSWKMAG